MIRAFHENPRWERSAKRDDIRDARWDPMARDEVWIRWNVAWCYVETRCSGVHGMQPSTTTKRYVDSQRNTYLICRVCGFIVTEDGLQMVRHDQVAARRRMRDAKRAKAQAEGGRNVK